MGGCEQITYRFHLPQGVDEISLSFESDSFLLLHEARQNAPDWARLDFHQCQHCPLTPEDSPFCPLAEVMSGFIEGFDRFYSYEEAVIEVVTKNRTVIGKKPLQHGMASLIGLIGATSGCPHLAFFRPMARFHLPFARDDETLYRVFSMFLLSRVLKDGQCSSVDLAELQSLTTAATLVNRDMAKRIRAAFEKDVVVNAIITLDSFAQAVPFVIEERLNELRVMFAIPEL